ncbi:hypothetical protein D3C87_1770140 [compost metagenome]
MLRTRSRLVWITGVKVTGSKPTPPPGAATSTSLRPWLLYRAKPSKSCWFWGPTAETPITPSSSAGSRVGAMSLPPMPLLPTAATMSAPFFMA